MARRARRRAMKRVILSVLALGLLSYGLFVMLAAPSVKYVPRPEALPAGDDISVLAWNLGYGGLGEESDFIADGGKSYLPPSPQAVDKNIAGITATLKNIDADVYILPETAKPSPLNYWRD